MVNLKLEPTEAQFVIAAVHATQIMGKDAQLVAGILNKIESKLENIVPVK